LHTHCGGFGYKADVMRLLIFFPLAYLAGVQGFALFAPYAAFFMILAYFLRGRRKAALVRVKSGSAIESGPSEYLRPGVGAVVGQD
jgi:hypothetical protein